MAGDGANTGMVHWDQLVGLCQRGEAVGVQPFEHMLHVWLS